MKGKTVLIAHINDGPALSALVKALEIDVIIIEHIKKERESVKLIPAIQIKKASENPELWFRKSDHQPWKKKWKR